MMKIGQQNDPAMIKAQTSPATVAKAGQDAAASAAAKNERKASGVGVTMSNTARALAQTSSGAPEVDAAKVDAMREAIAQKTFVVNSEAIADKLLANAREMLARAR